MVERDEQWEMLLLQVTEPFWEAILPCWIIIFIEDVFFSRTPGIGSPRIRIFFHV